MVAVAALAAVFAWRLVDEALDARSHLGEATAQLAEWESAVLAGDVTAAGQLAAEAQAEVERASELVNGQNWTVAADLPLPGTQNLRAIQSATDVADAVVRGVVVPLSAFDPSKLVPADGGIDVGAIAAIGDELKSASAVIESARAELERVDARDLLSQVADPLMDLKEKLDDAAERLAPLRDVIGVLPAALGSEQPRNYVLMFQGNSEARSLGGNAAVFMNLRAEQGRLSIGEAVSSSAFHHRETPIVELSPDSVNIFGDKIGRYTPDFTMVPNFPEAVGIFRGWWADGGYDGFEAAISVDPIALSYVLQATGPIVLATGDELSAENAASLLLNEVYYRFPDPEAQNAFFASAAASVFQRLMSGQVDPTVLMGAFARSVEEGRFLFTSTLPDEQTLAEASRMGGVMPADDAAATTLGVFVNDNTGSKKSYYLDLHVAASNTCTATRGSEVSLSATLTSKLSAETAPRLPYYITGPFYAPSDISSFVVLLGPVGASVAGVTLDGNPVSAISSGQLYGRPAVKVEVLNHLDDAHLLQATFTMPESASPVGRLDVWHSPMSRATQKDVTSTSCNR